MREERGDERSTERGVACAAHAHQPLHSTPTPTPTHTHTHTQCTHQLADTHRQAIHTGAHSYVRAASGPSPPLSVPTCSGCVCGPCLCRGHAPAAKHQCEAVSHTHANTHAPHTRIPAYTSKHAALKLDEPTGPSCRGGPSLFGTTGDPRRSHRLTPPPPPEKNKTSPHSPCLPGYSDLVPGPETPPAPALLGRDLALFLTPLGPTTPRAWRATA